MKRLLLLINILLVCGLTGDAQSIVKTTTTTTTTTASKKSQKTATAKSSRKATTKHYRKKKRKLREIDHPAPDQAKIDSIKNEKMKYKK